MVGGGSILAEVDGNDPPQLTVHVVDDDASVRTALSRLFRSSGHTAKTYDTARAYLDESSPNEPGCVVLDIKMPGMDGLTLQERMAERGLNAPIVFISGHADVTQSVRAMKHGAVDFFEKPFDDKDLLNAVDRAIELDTALRKQLDGSPQTMLGLERLDLTGIRGHDPRDRGQAQQGDRPAARRHREDRQGPSRQSHEEDGGRIVGGARPHD